MGLSGNRGEWSEVYALFKLLSEGKLYAADSNLDRIPGIIYPIIKILRKETNSAFEFELNSDNFVVISGEHNYKIPVSVFTKYADLLLNKIKTAPKQGSFQVPEVESFMQSYESTTIKARSIDKSDIKIKIHDHTTGICPTLGFSIKSRLGSPSTLLNPGKTTNFIYSIKDIRIPNGRIEEINQMEYTKDRIEAVIRMGGRFVFNTAENNTFSNNLSLIDSELTKIVAEMLYLFFSTGTYLIKDVIDQITTNNPLGYDLAQNHPFYMYKIKHFLTDVALGMTPAKVWNGNYDATGGYLIVKEDGDIVCYHIFNKNQFEHYLIENTKFDSASRTRYEYGEIYTDSQTGEHFIKLNLQIRFIK